ENTKESETVEDGNEEKSDTLIVYFSWSNNTETMANYIHEQIGGDIERIVPVDAYPDNYNETADLAKAQQDNDERPQFEALAYDPTTYDTVFIGYPIWWYSLPMIMETFFDTYDFTGITIVPFNTHEGSKDGGTYEMIREREPGATVLEGLPIRGRDVNDTSSKDEVREWLGKLNLE
ncbi:MAG: NAD(P)H-dependent oxidoreductase, partial [Erysipelotrichaceae bacterium]|nr:NAD(P)H-dependent oxidoreductase [Erysipelotrichaceae bacterium]